MFKRAPLVTSIITQPQRMEVSDLVSNRQLLFPIDINDTYLNKILVLKNSLRGYPLDGCKFDVPKEYQGVVFHEIQKPLQENTDRTFKANGTFSNFTYWNYDREPSDNDVLKQALLWNEFANVVRI